MYKLPELKYSVSALEPVIDELTVETHYSKHHQGYTNKLNKAVSENEEFFANKTIEEVLSNIEELPADIKTWVVNNGGGYHNHIVYWEQFSPNGGGEATGNLGEAINRDFGSFAKFKEQLSNTANTLFGSGWAWLVVNESGNLEIMTTTNQDSPLSVGKKPLIAFDIWEHAYYLQYQNRRPEHIEKLWNILDFDALETKYNEYTK